MRPEPAQAARLNALAKQLPLVLDGLWQMATHSHEYIHRLISRLALACVSAGGEARGALLRVMAMARLESLSLHLLKSTVPARLEFYSI